MDVAARYGMNLDGTVDNAQKLAQMAADIAALPVNAPLPRLTFPAGIYAFSAWPDLAYSKLQIVADGECRLIPLGNANIVFDASLRDPSTALPTNNKEPQIENFLFDGFDVYAEQNPTPLVFRGIHRSRLRTRVICNNTTRVAIQMTFCIITVLEAQVSNQGGHQNPTGVLMDAWPGKPGLQSTASTIINPCLEGCNIGLDMQSAGSCSVYNGTIESCQLGVHLGAASGHNLFYSVEMEGNGLDVSADGGAHNNRFLYCGNDGKLNTNFNIFSTNWSIES